MNPHEDDELPGEIIVQFSYDDLQIKGVINKTVYVEGELWPEHGEGFIPCALLIERPLFRKTLDMWLRAKKQYCTAYRNYHRESFLCDTMGTLRATEFTELPEDQRCVFPVFDEGKDRFVRVAVRSFMVTAFDENLDMENEA